MQQIFIRTGRTPDEVLEKPAGVRAFIFAAIRWQLEKESEQK